MSGASAARLTKANSSSSRRWSRYHLLLAMRPPQLVGHGLQFDGVLQDRVVAVPLHEVGPAHESAVLGRPAVVVPQVEVGEVDRLRERLAEQVVLAQPVDD